MTTTGLLTLFLSFRGEPWLLWLFPLGSFVVGRYLGKHFWNNFFTDRLSFLGLLGLFLGLTLGLCYLDPLWLSTFWLTMGGGLVGLGGALTGIKLPEHPDLITPDPLVQHPLRVNRLLSITVGWLTWSIPDIPIWWRAPLTIFLTTLGLIGLGNWHLEIKGKDLRLGFNGIISSFYRFNLDRFQRLMLVKLQEGGISWLQIANPREEITLPIILLETTANRGEIAEILSQHYPLARQTTTRDSLQMIGILLPQAMGVFAGISCLILGTILWSSVEIPESQSYYLTWILGGSFLLAPPLSSALFLAIVPGSIAPHAIYNSPPWELGALLILVNLANTTDVISLIISTIVFLSWGIGIYAFQLVRIIPIGSKLI